MRQIRKSDFSFRPTGFGRYVVTYTTPINNKVFTTVVEDMEIIDAVKNEEYPAIRDMIALRKYIKNNQ